MTSTPVGAQTAGLRTHPTPGSPAVRAERRRSVIGFVLAMPPVLLLAAFVGLPVVFGVAFTLGYTGGLNRTVARIGAGVHEAEGGPTLAAFADLFADPRFPRDLVATVLVTLVTTVVTLLLATAIAVHLRLSGSRVAKLLSGLAVVPLFIPVVIASWSMLSFYSSDGFLRSLLARFGMDGPTFGFTLTGVILTSIWVNLPFTTLMATSGMQAVPDQLIDAARDAGAGLWSIIRRILLPMAAIPLLIAATFTAIGALGQFTVPYFTGPNAPQQLGVDISKYFQSFNLPQQSMAIAVVVFVIASGFAVAYVWANARDADSVGRS